MPSVEDTIKKDFGDNILITGNHITERKRDIIPVSPALDIALNGGIISSSVCTFSGLPKCGKTSTALYFAATAQKEEYGSRDVFFFNIEHRLKPRDIECVPGLKMDKFFVIESSQDKILNAAEHLEIAHRLISTKKKIVTIFDSFSCISTELEQNEDMSKSLYDTGNKLIARFMRKIAPLVLINDTIVIILQHMQVNLSGFGSPLVEKSATSVKHQVDNKLICKSFSPWKLSQTADEHIGQKIVWQVGCSSIGPPGRTANSYLLYGKSISKEMELIEISKDLNLIEQSASWLKMSFLSDIIEGEPPKIQGAENARQFLVDNPEYTNVLNKKVREIFGLKV